MEELIIINKKERKCKIADKDIKCFKLCRIIGNTIFSYYEDFKFKLNKTYKQKIITSPSIRNPTLISGGFCSYSNNCKIKIKKYRNENNIQKIIIDNEIFYQLENEYIEDCICIINCIIPKNTKYFIYNNKIISSRIRLINIMNYE